MAFIVEYDFPMIEFIDVIKTVSRNCFDDKNGRLKLLRPECVSCPIAIRPVEDPAARRKDRCSRPEGDRGIPSLQPVAEILADPVLSGSVRP